MTARGDDGERKGNNKESDIFSRERKKEADSFNSGYFAWFDYSGCPPHHRFGTVLILPR